MSMIGSEGVSWPAQVAAHRAPAVIRNSRRDCILCEQGLYHITVDIRQAEPAALEFVSQFLVVDAELVEKGGLQIVHVDGVGGDVIRKIVGGAVAEARLEAAAGHPHCEATRMMVAPVISSRELSLGVTRAPEFATPN